MSFLDFLKMLLITLLFCGLTVSCSESRSIDKPQAGTSKESKKKNKNSDEEEEEEEQDLETKLASIIKTNPRPKVSAFVLDGASFKINGLRVNTQTFMTSEVPVLLFMMPERADFVQIIRCNSSSVVRGGTDVVGEVELGTSTADELTAIFQANRFWEAATDTKGCRLVVEGYSGKENFYDWTAPSGSFRYIARACVQPSRVIGKEFLTTSTCTAQVVASPILLDYQDKREDELREAIADAESDRAKIEGLGRTLYFEAINYNNALAECQRIEKKRMIKERKKNAITNLIGMGVSLGANIATATIDGGSSAKEVFSSMWKERNAIAGSGTAIGALIQDLTASSDDYAKTCTSAAKYEQSILAIKKDMKTTHEILAEKVEFASSLKDAKEELEVKEQ